MLSSDEAFGANPVKDNTGERRYEEAMNFPTFAARFWSWFSSIFIHFRPFWGRLERKMEGNRVEDFPSDHAIVACLLQHLT